jgi:SAM-dependent methyltransferase
MREKVDLVNQRQKEFYNSFKKNKATKFWYSIRNTLLRDMRKVMGIESQIYTVHREWMGDLSSKKVLDLGCYAGNSLSYYLAENALEYVGIDLSDKAIFSLRQKIKKLPNAKAFAIDFLSDDFAENEFDLIYAYGVLHHFHDTDELIQRLQEKLKIGGHIISYDPLQTSLPVNIARKLYRPFQSDKDWEWPFTRKTYYKYEKAFQILERRAIFGRAKWFFMLNILPISREKKLKIGSRWHKDDWKLSEKSDKDLFRCMHLTLWMQKK